MYVARPLSPTSRARAHTVAPPHAEVADAARKRAVNLAIEEVAAQLGNPPSVCRKSSIDPQVIDGFLRAA